MVTTLDRTAVLIPAYNASYSLAELLQRTVLIVSPKNIFVIDDGSTDATTAIAECAGIHILRHETNRGKGAALQTGFDFAVRNNFYAVITMDADLQHKPEDIPRFVALHEVCQYDVIIGNRLHNKKGMPLHRIASNVITTFLVNARTGIAISDSQSGFRFIRTNVIQNISLASHGFEAETEFLIKAAEKHFTIGSLPIETIYAGEKSNMTHVATTINFITTLFKQY